MKLLAIVLVVVVCGLQTARAVPLLGSDNSLERSDKTADLSPAAAGEKLLAFKRAELGRQLFDLQGVLRALQNVVTAINAQIQKTTNDFINGVNKAVQDAQTAANTAVSNWNSRLQAVIDGADAFDSTLKDCQSRFRSLDQVAQSLSDDVRACASNATDKARAALQQLDALGPAAQTVFEAASAAVAECQQQALLMQPVCLASKVPDLVGRGAALAADATRLGAQVTGELLLRVPLENAGCVGTAIGARNQESAQIIAGVAQCVRDNLTTPAA